LIHSAPYRLVDGKKVYEDLDALGNYPASHGCIRLAPEDAAWFTAWKPQGAPLVVLPRKSAAG
jgi:lipoprotein-anchoring transpeptidase ErfK/SrfK